MDDLCIRWSKAIAGHSVTNNKFMYLTVEKRKLSTNEKKLKIHSTNTAPHKILSRQVLDVRCRAISLSDTQKTDPFSYVNNNNLYDLVSKTSVFGWWTFPDLCLIYG